MQDKFFIQFLKKKLTRNEYLVMKHRFGFEGMHQKSLRAIAAFMGYSKEGIRKIEQRTLQKLKKLLKNKEDWIDYLRHE